MSTGQAGGEDVAAAADAVRRWVDVATWTAIGLGLAFTAVNVAHFAAAGAEVWSAQWLVAWLLDPMVSVLLLAVVRAEQLTARWQVPMGWQVVAVKWAAFAATYVMNTWSAWRDGIPSAVVLHSVPPVFVLLAAEVAPVLRDRLTEAVQAATAAAPATPSAPHSSFPVVAEDLGPVERDDDQPLNDQALGADAAVPAGRRVEPDPAPEQRVRELVELLAAGCDVTGPQAAALHGVSERTGRRLVADARTHLDHQARPDLHLVEAHTAGGTA